MTDQKDFTTSRVPDSATTNIWGIMGVIVGLGSTCGFNLLFFDDKKFPTEK